jgi:hypothetical protein
MWSALDRDTKSHLPQGKERKAKNQDEQLSSDLAAALTFRLV